MAARKSREKKMAKIRHLKEEHQRRVREHAASVKEVQLEEANKVYFLRQIEKLEAEVKRRRAQRAT